MTPLCGSIVAHGRTNPHGNGLCTVSAGRRRHKEAILLPCLRHCPFALHVAYPDSKAATHASGATCCGRVPTTACLDGLGAELCNHLAGVLGERWSAPLALLRTWTFSVFYMVADMWGSIGELGLLGGVIEEENAKERERDGTFVST